MTQGGDESLFPKFQVRHESDKGGDTSLIYNFFWPLIQMIVMLYRDWHIIHGHYR